MRAKIVVPNHLGWSVSRLAICAAAAAGATGCGESTDEPGVVPGDETWDASAADTTAPDSSKADGRIDGGGFDVSVDARVDARADVQADVQAEADAPPVEPSYALDCSQHPGLLHPVFGDQMVLQRDAWDPVWGCAQPASKVTVAIAGKTVSATADANGFWHLRLAPMPHGGPYDLTVSGSESRTLHDVMVGDVWLCSGQSNMQMGMSGVMNASQEIADAVNHPNLRLFRIQTFKGTPKPEQVFHDSVSWQKAAANTVPGFSATCYLFAKDLSGTVDVAMGLIESAYGGTAIQWWMSAESLIGDPDFGHAVADILDAGHVPDALYETSLYNGMIAPLLPFMLRGMVWYQGEANAGNAPQYQRLLPNMIQDWRGKFGAGETPFLVVQLPRYATPQTDPSQGQWAPLREAQLHAFLSVPHVGLAVTIDTGVPVIDGGVSLHPTDKQDVGSRLAISARGVVYGESIAHVGPIYKSKTLEGSKIRLTFDHVQTGLMVGSKQPLEPVKEVTAGKLSGFAIAGADKKFVWATATIEGNSVVVSAPSVTAPEAVRYGWASNPPCNLYGKEGLPASPFRTDTW
jgi:sialate O-acetylesterase